MFATGTACVYERNPAFEEGTSVATEATAETGSNMGSVGGATTVGASTEVGSGNGSGESSGGTSGTSSQSTDSGVVCVSPCETSAGTGRLSGRWCELDLSLELDADSWVDEELPSDNHGDSTELRIDVGSGMRMITLMAWPKLDWPARPSASPNTSRRSGRGAT